MKRLSLSLLLASTLMITACGGDSNNAAVGTAPQIDAITKEYHEKMNAVKPTQEPAVIPMDEPADDVIGGAANVHSLTAQYHEKMKAAQ